MAPAMTPSSTTARTWTCKRRRSRCQFQFLTSPTLSSWDANLPYGDSHESLNHVRACIRHLSNHCVKDERGQPVSWMLSDELCELRMVYSLTEHRWAGHLLALMRRMSSVGLPVYSHVNQQNQATIKAVTSLGFTACPSMEDNSVLLICKDRV